MLFIDEKFYIENDHGICLLSYDIMTYSLTFQILFNQGLIFNFKKEFRSL